MPFYFYNRYSDDQCITLPGQSTLLDSGQKSEWRHIIEISSIIRPCSRTFYVSPRSVYVWTSSQEGSAVYRLALDGGMPDIALADGVPVDQCHMVPRITYGGGGIADVAIGSIF